MLWNKSLNDIIDLENENIAMHDWCLFFTEINNLLLMNVCTPCFGIHSRAGQRLTGERMNESILQASGSHSRDSQR